MRAHSATPGSAPTPDARGGLAQWQALTRDANTAFDRRQYDRALCLYAHALRLATDLANGPALSFFPDDCLAALVVAHHNLSDARRLGGDRAAALDHLCLPHEALLRIVSYADAPDATRLAAVRHLRETRLALLDWQKRCGACARTDALLTDGLAALASIDAGAQRH